MLSYSTHQDEQNAFYRIEKGQKEAEIRLFKNWVFDDATTFLKNASQTFAHNTFKC